MTTRQAMHRRSYLILHICVYLVEGDLSHIATSWVSGLGRICESRVKQPSFLDEGDCGYLVKKIHWSCRRTSLLLWPKK
ncbi:hypothetical protein F5Y06DRAFT_267698 [Hypoxylon sp. FL0890]|nr:hypothetical protein F5Y06DRAFT_267698 [Hypoxylon sp. FL0890]